MKITEPGVYTDLPAADYHQQHEWLSNSGMKKLVPPSCPAKFKAALEAPDERKRTFDLGKVVHTLTLGDGDEFVVVEALDKQKQPYPATDYLTVSSRTHRDAIYEAGKVPILAAELKQAQAMAAVVKAHPLAGALLSNGIPEVSLFWIDEATGVKCRARLDWLPNPQEGRRLLVPDLKTAVSAEPGEFSRNAARFGYASQHAHYLDGIKACGLADDPAFLFCIVEKESPHIVTVGQFQDKTDLDLATAINDKARRIYKACKDTDTWPGYVDGIADLSLPMWFHYQLEEFVA